MPPARFEPAISASERPQTHPLGRAITGIGTTEINTLHKIITGQQRASHYDVSILELEWLVILTLHNNF
jgi:hypothetical protein